MSELEPAQQGIATPTTVGYPRLPGLTDEEFEQVVTFALLVDGNPKTRELIREHCPQQFEQAWRGVKTYFSPEEETRWRIRELAVAMQILATAARAITGLPEEASMPSHATIVALCNAVFPADETTATGTGGLNPCTGMPLATPAQV